MIRPPNRVEMLSYLPTGGIVAEVGVARGLFATEIFCKLAPMRMYLIDPWQQPYSWQVNGVLTEFSGKEQLNLTLERFQKEIASGAVIPVISPSLVAIPLIEMCDVWYYDALHDYNSVRANLLAMLPRTRPGGWIAGHDYCEIHNSGTPRAVDEFCTEHNLQINMLTDEPSYPVLRRHPRLPDRIAYNSFAIQVP